MPAELDHEASCGKFGDKGAKPKRIRYKPITR
jgi:hypothetical protein